MQAKIVKIDKNTVTLKNRSGKFIDIKKSKLKFDYTLGDTIDIDKNGDEYYYTPHHDTDKITSMDDFYEEDAKGTKSLNGINGLLSFFIVTSILGLVIGTINTISTDYNFSRLNGHFYNFYTAEALLITENFIFFAVTIYQIVNLVSIITKKKAAISRQIFILSIRLLWAIIATIFIANLTSDIDSVSSRQIWFNYLPEAIGATVASILWIIYFATSKRVRNTLTY